MSWIQLSVYATAAQAEMVSEACMALGALAVTFQDAHDQPILEPLPGETPFWRESEIIALYDVETDMAAVLANLQQQLPAALFLSIRSVPLAERDWVRDARAHFVPLQFGERLWICPSWHSVPQADAVTVLLDPGLAFGTGSHPTTALCLAWLAAQPLAGKSVIDFGCGSGILAIAALKLGAASAVGIDIDPQALQASRDNAQRNGVADRLTLHLASKPPANTPADVVIANILAEPLRHLAAPISRLVSAGGHLVLSGILTTQAEAVMAAYRDHFTFEPPCQREEWCCISGVAHSPREVKMLTRIVGESAGGIVS